MGKYLNPRGKSKEEWLFDNGFIIPNPSMLAILSGDQNYANHACDLIDDCGCVELQKITGEEDFAKVLAMGELTRDAAFFNKYVIVDLINNGKFRAAAVYENRNDVMAVYNNPSIMTDKRQRVWFVVERELAIDEIRPMALA